MLVIKRCVCEIRRLLKENVTSASSGTIAKDKTPVPALNDSLDFSRNVFETGIRIFLVAIILPVLAFAASPCSGAPRSDGQCGPNAGGASCVNKQSCCSRFGYCGIGADWCNANSLCPASSSTPGGGNNNQSPTTISINNGPGVKLPPPVIGKQRVRALTGCGKGKRVVALTFDDGPQPVANTKLLAELKANNIKATFFSSPQANGAEQLPARCDLVKAIVNAGHQLEQHSMTHPHFPQLDQATMLGELQKSAEFLKRCGGSPKVFRPPFGELTSAQTTKILKDLDLPIVMWNVDPRDYEGAGVDVNFGRVVSEFETTVGIGNSAIVLLHELDEGTTSGLVTRLAQYFRGLEYNFVTMDQCFAACSGPVCTSGPDDFPDIINAAISLL